MPYICLYIIISCFVNVTNYVSMFLLYYFLYLFCFRDIRVTEFPTYLVSLIDSCVAFAVANVTSFRAVSVHRPCLGAWSKAVAVVQNFT